MNLHKLFDKCRSKWGLPFQIVQLVEELNELGVASLHLLRNRGDDKQVTLNKFAEEIADVELMLEEMKYYFHNDKLIQKHRKLKLKRLELLLRR